MSKLTFAALMDQPKDVELATFVKNGAFHTIHGHSASHFFAVNVNEDYFLVQNVWQLIGEDIVVQYKPSTMERSVSGYAERDMLGRGSLEQKTWLRGFQGNIYTPDEAYNANQDY